jgi:hypothetical protein
MKIDYEMRASCYTPMKADKSAVSAINRLLHWTGNFDYTTLYIESLTFTLPVLEPQQGWPLKSCACHI